MRSFLRPPTNAAVGATLVVATLAVVACAHGDVPRLGAADVHARVSSGKALLICAYDDDAKCHESDLEGAMSLAAFEAKADGLPRGQQLIFYCS